MSNNRNENLRDPFYSPVDDPNIFPWLEPGKVKKERSGEDASVGKIDKDTWTLSDYNSAPQDRLPFLLSRANNFENSDFDRPASSLNEEFRMPFRSPVKSSPCDMRRRSSDQLGTAPPLAGINSDTSSSSDARQHFVQVDNHIDYMESESNAPPPSNNHFSVRNMSPHAAGYHENWEFAKGLMSGMRSSESGGSPVKSSPCDIRRRSSDQLGTAPPLAAINSGTSSSLDARQHLVQVDNHIDYTESESDAPPPSNNHYSGAEGLMSGMRSSGSTGSSVTSSRRGKRRRSSDRFDTEPPIAASDSGTSSSPDTLQYMPYLAPELLENRERPGNSMPNNFSNSIKIRNGNRLSGSTGIPAKSPRRGKRRRYTQSFGTAPSSSPDTRQHYFQDNPPQLILQVDDSDDFIENYTESEQSVPPNLDRNLPTTPSPDGSKENEMREKKKKKKRELNRRNQKTCADKKRENCKKAREEIPRLREEWKSLKRANQNQFEVLNDRQKREIKAISKRFEKQLADAESSVEKLKTKPIKDDKEPAYYKDFRRKQNLVLKQQELEDLRLKKQQDISKKIRELTC